MAGTEFTIRADLVLLAMGFLHPVREAMIDDLGVVLDTRGNLLADTRHLPDLRGQVFTAGDMRGGQSLVVWAIAEGRGCARGVDLSLTGDSNLPA